MVKRRLLVLVLALCLFVLPAALAAEDLVIDEAQLYTTSEILEMEMLMQDMIDRYQMDVRVLTTYDVKNSRGDDSVTVAYADAYYEDHGYGVGEDASGVLFIVDMTNRFNYLTTAGTMIDYLNDHRIEELLSSADDALSRGRYGTAMLTQLGVLRRMLQSGVEEGQFRYDAVTGRRLTGLYNKLTTMELGLALLAGAVAALGIYLTVSRTYLLKGGTYRYSLDGRNVRLDMTRNEEHFIRESVVRTEIPRDGGGGGGGGGHGSSVHTSSGGMSHGGGGHHF